VHEQERRPFPGREEPDTGSTPFVVLLFEAREKYRRIRHVDRLFCEHCELAGDKAGNPLIPCLRAEELTVTAETSPLALRAAGFFVRERTMTEGARWPTT